MADKYANAKINLDFESMEIPTRRVRGSVVQRYLKGLTHLLHVHERLLYANLILDWFYEFREYWCGYLGNRPISVQDFHALRHDYRKRFQDVAFSLEGPDLKTWQEKENIYSVFGSVWGHAFSDVIAYKYAKHLRKGDKVLEYGCGIAPVTYSFLRYYPNKAAGYTIADIPTHTFHYAKWRFGTDSRVNTVRLNFEEPYIRAGMYDVIFCLNVFEHLPAPLLTAENLVRQLNQEGVLIWNYIESDGEGLDTKAGVSQRASVVEFIMRQTQTVKLNIKSGTVVSQKI